MKKLVIFISATMFCISSMAAVSSSNWVVTGNARISCEKINLGISKVRIVLENGHKLIVPIAKLESYSVNGLVFDKKILYKNGKSTGQIAFMQLLKKRGNLCLYRNVEFNRDPITPLESYDGFYVYNGEELYLGLDKKSMPNAFMFFGLKLSYR